MSKECLFASYYKAISRSKAALHIHLGMSVIAIIKINYVMLYYVSNLNSTFINKKLLYMMTCMCFKKKDIVNQDWIDNIGSMILALYADTVGTTLIYIPCIT